jgi:hypothetical protein
VQYPKLEVKHTNIFHDRYLILDGKTVYHTGLFALDKKSGKCDYVWTPPGSEGWKLMQNARKIDVSKF